MQSFLIVTALLDSLYSYVYIHTLFYIYNTLIEQSHAGFYASLSNLSHAT